MNSLVLRSHSIYFKGLHCCTFATVFVWDMNGISDFPQDGRIMEW
jgi:hypothetical protein